jgi:DNA-directed RNA polymerase subunit RPC12/RpoP
MKYECKSCGHIHTFDIVVPLVKCTRCEYITIYKKAELEKIMESRDES